jgi:hypothetical protein
MPLHDWTRVRSNRFHDFHQGWTVELCNALNSAGLPAGYFAMIETKTRGLGLDDDLDLSDSHLPNLADAALYARRANRITIRRPDGIATAVLEIVSPGNKDSVHAAEDFARKAVDFLLAGVHLLIVDLFPPGPRDPQGIHKLIWDRLCDEPFALPPDKPLTLAAYEAGPETVAYVEPVAVGDPLPDMPVFFAPGRHVKSAGACLSDRLAAVSRAAQGAAGVAGLTVKYTGPVQ